MVEFEETLTKTPHVQLADADIEASGRRPEVRRTNSNISNTSNIPITSFNGPRSRRGSIDPAAALPIQYRTVSFQIDEGAAELKKVKDDAAKGMRSTRY
jgi:sodium/potassium-transporting ATPase subunit alpha